MAILDDLTRVTSLAGVTSDIRVSRGHMDPIREFSVSPHVQAAAELRSIVTDWIPDHPRLIDVKHVLSELVNNAVVHARLPTDSQLRVRMMSDRSQLRFEVVYPNTTGSRSSRRVRSSEGYGLGIVDKLVDNWGVETSPDQVVDWFEIRVRTYQDH